MDISPLKSEPTSPVNMYIGENFSVMLDQYMYFKMQNLVTDNSGNGVIHTKFDSFKKIDNMSLSNAAQKLRDVPNAGGNSVVSEVLSFELLRRCFGGHLLKVSLSLFFIIELYV